MRTCTICHFQTELDDVAVTLATDRCVCLRCFGRETGSAKPMPKNLRREIIAALSTADVA
jgi:recombinational DNA repair protein (RecF pathway)